MSTTLLAAGLVADVDRPAVVSLVGTTSWDGGAVMLSMAVTASTPAVTPAS
jgi:hypothetical protein